MALAGHGCAVAKTADLRELALAGGGVYWAEMRPEEQGRHVIAKRVAGSRTESIFQPE